MEAQRGARASSGEGGTALPSGAPTEKVEVTHRRNDFLITVQLPKSMGWKLWAVDASRC